MKVNINKIWRSLYLSPVLLFSYGLNADAPTYDLTDFAALPTLITKEGGNPFVMINLSIEHPQQGEAYTDDDQVYAGNGTYCPGRWDGGYNNTNNLHSGVCYSADETYIGYFNPDKCYEYRTGDPSYSGQSSMSPNLDENGVAVSPTAPPHFYPISDSVGRKCSGELFAGNYMNWATMTAVDSFRGAMTGGARVVDTTGSGARTILARAKRGSDEGENYWWDKNHWAFIPKVIRSSGFTLSSDEGSNTFTNNPSDVTPFSAGLLVARNFGERSNVVRFYDTGTPPADGFNTALNLLIDGVEVSEFHVNVAVCVAEANKEDNCVRYENAGGSEAWYKPEGVLQENAGRIRFALSSYSSRKGTEDSNGPQGGVLRTEAKFIGPYVTNEDGDLVDNPAAEFDSEGKFVLDPDASSNPGEGVLNSGIINYINNFALGEKGYKQRDPASELFYEGLRYMLGAGSATDAYYTSSIKENADKDNFPALQNWDDPITEACQSNFMMYFGDQFPQFDSDLPGYSGVYPQYDGRVAFPRENIPIEPLHCSGDGGADDASCLRVNAQTWTKELSEHFNAYGGDDVDSGVDYSTSAPKRVAKENHYDSYAIAGLAYGAWTKDIRPDLEGDQHIKTFIVDTQEYSTDVYQVGEHNQMWLAARYGGYEKLEGFDGPVNQSQWDKNLDDDNDNPDNYTLASQPKNLVDGLKANFGEIINSVGTGSGSGVVSNTVQGQGMIVQALYKPKITDGLGNSVEWGGILHALFVDEYDNLREDLAPKGVLTDADPIVRYSTDPVTKEVSVTRYMTNDGGETLTELETDTAGSSVEDVRGIWNARDELAKIDGDPSAIRENRDEYISVIGTSGPSRFIFTAIDKDGDGIVSSSADTKYLEFVEDKFPSTGASEDLEHNFRLLGLNDLDKSNSENIVNFIRGEEIPGMRSRMVEFDDDGPKMWRLGDIVSSSPTIVGAPSLNERYDLIYGDNSYEEFYEEYQNRRHVVYTGANDGMLHAFNAGFFDEETGSYSEIFTGKPSHPFGAELWSYVPYNLLPHLKWLTDPNYEHVFYVDGEPQTFDVNIFPDDATHPGGWGTILVVGMRYGGGDYTIDPDGDAGTDNNKTMRSAYIILDITDPEQKPELIAEISHEKMGYTFSRPTVVKARESGAGGAFTAGNDKWYLVMGSGPYGESSTEKANAVEFAESSQTPKVFVFDLQDKEFETFSSGGESKQYLEVPSSYNGFTGDFLSVDWDKDYKDDAVYFGTVTNTLGDPKGDLFRLPIGSVSLPMSGVSSSSMKPVATDGGSSLGLPVSGRAYAYTHRGKHWLTFGTGRFYVDQDSKTSKQMQIFGVKEPFDGSFAASSAPDITANLADTTDVNPQFVVNTSSPWDAVLVDETGAEADVVLGGGITESVSNYVSLREAINSDQTSGWRYTLTQPHARQIGQIVGEGPVILFSEYWPSDESCDPIGSSYLSQLYIGTGHAAPFFGLNIQKSVPINGEQSAFLNRWINPGEIIGKVKEAAKTPGGDAVVQSSTGEILPPIDLDEILSKSGIISWREIPINWQ